MFAKIPQPERPLSLRASVATSLASLLVPAPPCDPQVTKERSLNRVYQGSLGNGAVDVSDGGGAPAGEIGETMAELKRLQKLLVAQLQAEFFCDDVEPPPAAFGWDEGKLRDYFENGGE